MIANIPAQELNVANQMRCIECMSSEIGLGIVAITGAEDRRFRRVMSCWNCGHTGELDALCIPVSELQITFGPTDPADR